MKPRYSIDRKTIDLALAWCRNELRYTDFCKQTRRGINGNGYITIVRALKVAYRSNLPIGAKTK